MGTKDILVLFSISGAIAHSSLNQKAPVAYTSSATKELDDLMASLSDFKVKINLSDSTLTYNLTRTIR